MFLTKKIFLLVVSLLIVFIFLEVFLRVAHIDDAGFERIKLRRNLFFITGESSEFGTFFKPGVSVNLDYTGREKSEIITNFTTLPIPGNELYGMRDDGVNKERIIIVLGDSYTWGATVNSSDIWLEQIENRNGIDMINIAQGGGISKALVEYNTIEDKLPKHDVVIYAAGLINEFLDNYAFAEAYKIGFNTKNIKKERWFYPIITKSKLAYLGFKIYSVVNIPVKNFLRKFSNNFKAPTDYLPEVDGYVDDNYGAFDITLPRNQISLNYALINNTNLIYLGGLWETKRAMKEFKDLLDSEGRVLVIVIIPFREQVYYNLIKDNVELDLDMRQPNNFILDACEEFDIVCIDATDDFVDNSDGNLFWFYDMHLTPEGQRVLSVFVENNLKNEGIL